MHGLGFAHENCRADRDHFIIVDPSKSPDCFRGGYYRVMGVPFGLYDVCSLTHYPFDTDIIKRIDENFSDEMQELPLPGTKLSKGDIEALQFLYPSLNAFGFEVSSHKKLEVSEIQGLFAVTEKEVFITTEKDHHWVNLDSIEGDEIHSVSIPKCFESRITSIWAATENAITMNTETGSFRFDFDKFSTQFVKPARPNKKTRRFNFKTAWVEVVDHQTVYEIIADPGNAEPPRILHSTKEGHEFEVTHTNGNIYYHKNEQIYKFDPLSDYTE